MKSAIYKKYGTPEVIQIIEKEKPTLKPNELLVRIKASSVTRADTMMRQGKPKFGRLFLGIFRPKNTSLGTGFSGIVESVGEEVTKFKISDEVFGEVLFTDGTNSEYVCVPEDGVIAIKPKTLSHQEAAPICDGFLTSYSFLRDMGELNAGQHILINGASGSLGTAAVQLSKLMGAKITGVCSTSNIDLVKSLGADIIVDYKKSDFSKAGDYYDVIYDAVGKSSYKNYKKALYYNGVFMSPVLTFNILWRSIIFPKKVKFSATGLRKPKDLKILLNDLVVFFKEGQLKTVIEKTYDLDNITEAHSHLDSGHKVGNIAIINK